MSFCPRTCTARAAGDFTCRPSAAKHGIMGRKPAGELPDVVGREIASQFLAVESFDEFFFEQIVAASQHDLAGELRPQISSVWQCTFKRFTDDLVRSNIGSRDRIPDPWSARQT